MTRHTKSLAEVLAGLSGEDNDNPAHTSILPEAQVIAMQDLAKRYEQLGRRFSVGDLVTPRADSHYNNAGNPQLVVEVRSSPSPNFYESSSTPDFGARHDIRVASVRPDGQVLAYWVESFYFDSWTA